MATLQDTSSTSGSLIAGSKVSSTSVYNAQGESLGSIEDVMIDKRSGRIAYAVLNFGGFLGIGGRHHPLPWSTLKYDTSLGGYVVNLDRRTLEGAPSYASDQDVRWEDQQWGRSVHDYYKAEPYWNAVP
ncbi:MAG: PRC-barrel domain-containing protein [Acidisphaera sp.]|nr:PRC-barrel domain-containing protein [Acidisphaera sp.]